jgi:hypothetical protein
VASYSYELTSPTTDEAGIKTDLHPNCLGRHRQFRAGQPAIDIVNDVPNER